MVSFSALMVYGLRARASFWFSRLDCLSGRGCGAIELIAFSGLLRTLIHAMAGMRRDELGCPCVRLDKRRKVNRLCAVHHIVILGCHTVHKRILYHVCES